MATSFSPVLLQLFDDNGDLLAGGTIDTYAAGTTTRLATYQDLGGNTANTNPVVLDSAGRGTIRLTDGTAYKFVVKDASGNTVETLDNIIVGVAPDSSSDTIDVVLTYTATPAAQGFMGGEVLKHACSFPIDFAGAGGAVVTNPASNFVISIQKNDVEVGTATINSSGVFTFATTGGTTVSFASGDRITFIAPSSVGTAANFMVTLVGTLA